jgi:UDP-GlcNAc:undecaprenyl-phosphate GlcNAc-1-phosphate transferase
VSGAATPVGDLGVWTLVALYVPVLIVSWAVTLIATPIVRLIAIRTGVVDRPDEARKLHRRPVAYLGGVAVFIGVLAGIATSYLLDVPIAFRPVPITVVLGMIAVVATGFGDDVWGWDPRLKIMGQLIAAAGLSMYGIGTQTAAAFLGYFLGTSQLGFEIPLFGGIPIDITEWIGVAIVAVMVLGGCNASNLIDGLDGLLSGTTAIIGGGLLVISLMLALHLTSADLTHLGETLPPEVANVEGLTLAGARIALCLALIGACVGFLAFNFNPALIFLGDAGSLLLGYLCVVIILTLGELGQTHFVLAGLIVFGLPIADTVLAIFRRKIQGLSASSPDANHLHHILLRHLGTVKQAVLGMWGIEVIFAMIGVALVALSTAGSIRVLATYVVFIGVFGAIAVIGSLMGLRAGREKSS